MSLVRFVVKGEGEAIPNTPRLILGIHVGSTTVGWLSPFFRWTTPFTKIGDYVDHFRVEPVLKQQKLRLIVYGSLRRSKLRRRWFPHFEKRWMLAEDYP